jgi:hypothetical protein
MSKKLTTEEFIKRAVAVHGDLYNYDEVIYINSSEKVSVLCLKHDQIFRIKPHNLLNKIGCPKCVNENRGKSKVKSKEIFVEQAIKIHHDAYDYSLVNYINTKTKISIRCIRHDSIFQQTPQSHLNKNGCPICGREGTAAYQRSNTKDFTEKLKNLYGEKYDYSRIDYLGNRIKIWLKCNIHDEWNKVIPSVVLNGSGGCPKCSIEIKSRKRKSNTADFTEKAKSIHGDRYTYDLVVYETARGKVSIKCVEHNKIFKMTPNLHLSGSGCPWCNRSKMENEIEKILNEFKIEYVQQKTFKDCKYKNKLRFDFYLPQYNTVIEYNGKQHYEPIEFYGGKKKFIERNIRDMIKRNYCKKYGINFIEIPYWMENKIEKYIKNIIS